MSQFQLTLATKANQAALLPILLVATSVNEARPAPVITINYEDATVLPRGDKEIVEFTAANGTLVYGSAAFKELLLSFPYLNSKEEKLENEWLAQLEDFASLDFKAIEPKLQQLNNHLILRSFVVGYALSTADIALWGALRGNRVAIGAIRKGTLINLTRWFNFLEELCPWAVAALEALNASAKEKRAAKAEGRGRHPFPSGAFWIPPHRTRQGRASERLLRPREEFQDAILEDLALMGIKPDKTSYSSDYFDELQQYAVQIIKDGNAYADDTDKETMASQRMNGEPSKRRDATVEENLARFEEMTKGTEEGARWCIRAKMSVDNPNKAMRDPVIYRCNPAPHHRTGTKYKAYPTYDFCCPIIDSLEGVTHALRTIEYRDRNPQYQWFLDTLKLRNVQIWDFARMNFVRTLLSKRKLTKLVEQGVVDGWSDPRFPTIRGIRRRGMTIPALREFILKQGPSRNIVNLDWTSFWATNKKYIDPVAPRHTAVLKKDAVKATIKGGPDSPYTQDKPKHNKNPDVGTKKVTYSSSILFDQEDAKSFKQDEEITLMNWGNAFVRKIVTDASGVVTELELDLNEKGDFKKTEKKVTWLSTDQDLVPVDLVDFDYLLNKDSMQEEDSLEDVLNPKTEFHEDAVADSNVALLAEGDIIQFERKGYYRLDKVASPGKPAVFFNIPSDE
ncbi:hypothetical protein AN8224.2 [Aspergillus nidulans FGSC A4]|nr:hypothetical protein AN8224.2 [Aspergillus nidulans FGSC A4]|eukprot:XP_681493.1 hypothetical protein AN8224.2 [Aspergillus nidulans FGSC A4]